MTNGEVPIYSDKKKCAYELTYSYAHGSCGRLVRFVGLVGTR